MDSRHSLASPCIGDTLSKEKNAMKNRIVIADSHPLVLFGARAAIEQTGEYTVVGKANCAEKLISLLETHPCDVVVTEIMNQKEPPHDGVFMIERIRDQHPHLPIVLLTDIRKPLLTSLRHRHRVHAVVSKSDDPSVLLAAIASVSNPYPSASPPHQGRSFLNATYQWVKLSPREAEVLHLLDAGLSITGIAATLTRSKQTISTQKSSAMRKLGVTNDAQLYSCLRAHGFAYQISGLVQSAPHSTRYEL
ncbi:response regulator transcription factor [Pseudomonas fluorescens]|uniref:response regulator transcription factor n=1 Tax=Pseudomonas fluorescens TaxID=294 RepID=UPI001CD6F71A|nr:response regulator transcription factor [Pseudomonas fluorescens]